MKSSHGTSTAAPKRITLKRKTLGTVRAAGSQGRKTVSVEVRKKRTYIKRDEAPVDETAVIDNLAPSDSKSSIKDQAVNEATVSEREAKQSVIKEQIEAVERDAAELDAAIDTLRKTHHIIPLMLRSCVSERRLSVKNKRF